MPFAANRLDWRLVALLVLIDAVLRSVALWKSARASQKWWFVGLFVVNSAGILPAIYLFLHRSPKSLPQPEILPPPSPRRKRSTSP